MNRSELALARQSIRNDWPVQPEHRAAVIKAASELLSTDKPRTKFAAMKVLLAADSLNIRSLQAKRPQETIPTTNDMPDQETVLRSLSREERQQVFAAQELIEATVAKLTMPSETDKERLLWVVKNLLTPEQQQAYVNHQCRNRQPREAQSDY